MSRMFSNALKKYLPFCTNKFVRPSISTDSVTQQISKSYVRNHSYMTSRLEGFKSQNLPKKSSVECLCGCSTRRYHATDILKQNRPTTTEVSDTLAQGERELADFLNEEIEAEKNLQKTKKVVQEIGCFKVECDGSEVKLLKKEGSELITISFNINHSVDSEGEDTQDTEQMKSKPNFEVEIKRDDKTIGFSCSMVNPQSGEEQQQQEYNDLFVIDELVCYDGKWREANYSVAGDVLDGPFYDLLMNYLEDKGVNNDLVQKIVDLSTSYEQLCYIKLLEDIQKFVQRK